MSFESCDVCGADVTNGGTSIEICTRCLPWRDRNVFSLFKGDARSLVPLLYIARLVAARSRIVPICDRRLERFAALAPELEACGGVAWADPQVQQTGEVFYIVFVLGRRKRERWARAEFSVVDVPEIHRTVAIEGDRERGWTDAGPPNLYLGNVMWARQQRWARASERLGFVQHALQKEVDALVAGKVAA